MKPSTIFLKITLLLAFLILTSCKNREEKVEVTENHKFTNALVNESSPYLLQHAHNPVNWRPWSQEALEDAKKENKLVLVSIGYSSCHWCHVMEEETFEDVEVAKVMNDNFVSIKVDREERPDVDQVYMTALQLISGNGGWPLNVITLPNGKPLYGGTYHTKEQWTQVLTKINDLYQNDPQKASEYADMVANGIAEANTIVPSSDSEILSKGTVRESVKTWSEYWDLEKGGDKGVQKFMIPSNLMFLLDYAILQEDKQAKAHVKNTLDNMAFGGIYDHLGGGFYRYSTDPDWKVPHFEKMLYDNAQVLSLYSKAFTVFKDERYKDIVWETVEFLQREMKNKDGGYYAALDADTEGEEGKYYVWGKEELMEVLEDDFPLFSEYYRIHDETVWEDGKFVLHRSSNDSKFLAENQIDGSSLSHIKSNWHKKLMDARGKRTFPGVDDKVITSWNALLIDGLVDAYKAFNQERFLDEAVSIFTSLKTHNYANGKLVHTYKSGSEQRKGFLEDYSFLAHASLSLYEVTFNTDYLDFARELTKKAHNQFYDSSSGLYFFNEGEELISKIVKTDDGVLPSPNAIMASNLFKLGHIDYNTEFMERSKKMLASITPLIAESPSSYSKWNSLLLKNTFPFFEIAIVGSNVKPVVQGFQKHYLPNTLVVGSKEKSDSPLFKDRFIEDETYIYVCQNTTCKLPVKTVEKALGQMKNF